MNPGTESPLACAGAVDSSKYLAPKSFGPPPAKARSVMDFSTFTDAELWPYAQCAGRWPVADLNGFGFAPADLARLKALIHTDKPAPPTE